MLIRTEIGVDAAGIDALLRRTFPTSDEAELVQQLREDGLLTLGVVATDDEGQVLGYAAFSPVTLQGEDLNWVALAPLAVDESIRGQDLGRKLVFEGLDTLNEFSYSAVVVLGDPQYYSRFGFEPALTHALHCKWPGSESAFQVYKLAEEAFIQTEDLAAQAESPAIKVEYSAPFDRFE
ncbi:GNAT family N-acetyltransferase [Pantoea sp. A4]|uniref:GNAT family N-acetyltransferase n=1 Tax=Pantoea sp. A4 TaxID=1225184 RepID=UPI0003670692|nr:N-acetyltransferase [Pantoea sp. A4]